MKTTIANNQTVRALTFYRCGIPFGVSVENVSEIRKFDELRPLALAIHPLVGVVTLGDRIIPVFDPHAFGSTQSQPVKPPVTTILCDHGGLEVALLCDDVANQVEMRMEELSRRTGSQADWLHGQVKTATGRKFLLLAVSRMAQLLTATPFAESKQNPEYRLI